MVKKEQKEQKYMDNTDWLDYDFRGTIDTRPTSGWIIQPNDDNEAKFVFSCPEVYVEGYNKPLSEIYISTQYSESNEMKEMKEIKNELAEIKKQIKEIREILRCD